MIGALSANNAPNAVTGVGFIGAGLTFRQSIKAHEVVRGVTTAASILAAAAIGAAAGEGLFLVAAAATGLVLLVLEIRYLPVLATWTRAAGSHDSAVATRSRIGPGTTRSAPVWIMADRPWDVGSWLCATVCWPLTGGLHRAVAWPLGAGCWPAGDGGRGGGGQFEAVRAAGVHRRD